MERIIELVLSLLLALGVTAPPGLGGSTPDGQPAHAAAPAAASGHAAEAAAGVAARVMTATDHVEGILAWVACVAETAATAPVPRDEDFDPRLGCGSLPVPPDEAAEAAEQADGAPFDVPPGDVPPLDVPPVDVPPLDLPPVDLPPVVPLEIPQVDIPPVAPPVRAVP